MTSPRFAWHWDRDTESPLLGSVDEAVEACLDGHLGVAQWPTELTVYCWERMKPKVDPRDVLEYVLEHLDEEMGDPDNYEGFEATETMKAAAEVFARVIEHEYVAWAYEPVNKKKYTVNVASWVRRHRTNWYDTDQEFLNDYHRTSTQAVKDFIDRHSAMKDG